MCVFIETSCSVQRGAVEWKTKPFQTVLSNHNIFTALSDCLAQTDAISPTRFPATPLSPTLLFAFISISFRLIADAFHMFKRRESKEEGLGIYSRIPMTQTPHTWASSDNRRIWLYTSVYNIFFSLFLPSMNGTIYTQSRYGSQFVSSPFSALLSVLSKECRVLFIQTIQSSIYFFPLLSSCWACCSD